MNIPYLDLKALNAMSRTRIEEAALRVIDSGQYLRGAETAAFERQWAEACGAAHCVSTANGLDALTAALYSLKHIHEWADGDEVIVSAHTFIASFEAITRAGLKPVPCDVSPTDYNIDHSLIASLINSRTVAIMPVHIYGRPCRMEQIRHIADTHKLKIVADSCQMHGFWKKDADFAQMSDATAYSFYPGKNLGALGDAGCLTTNDPRLADLARAYCNYGANIKYHHEIKGCNSRMDEIQAAILSSKLPFLNSQLTVRRQQAARYNQKINNPLITLPYGGKETEQSVWHIYPIFCKQRDHLQNYLQNLGISTIIHYPLPPHKQPAYRKLNALSLPITEQLCRNELSLPLNPALTTEQQDYIIDAINKFK